VSRLIAVRGAISVAEDSPVAIAQAVGELLTALHVQNGFPPQEILSAFFSVTGDLTSMAAARAAREQIDGWDVVPMMCFQEAHVVGLPARCIRVLIHWQPPHTLPEPPTPAHVYLGEATVLRPDRVLPHDAAGSV
jgi:chorismate mutase